MRANLATLLPAGLLPAALFLAAAPALARTSDDLTWFADYDQAVAQAVASGKDMLVKFTGSDWCPPCIRLENEVFSHAEFSEAMAQEFVLVKLDYPRHQEARDKVPNAERNAEVRDQFLVTGYPTVLLVTAEGEAYGQTGYRPGGAAAYIEHVTELRAKGRADLEVVRELVEQFEAAEGEARTAMIRAAAERLEGMQAGPVAQRLLPLVRAGVEGDDELKIACLRALMASGMPNGDDLAAARAADPANEHGLLEHCVLAQMRQVRDDSMALAALDELDALMALEGDIRDDEVARQTAVTGVAWCSQILEDRARAERYADYLRTRFADDELLASMLAEMLGDGGDGGDEG